MNMNPDLFKKMTPHGRGYEQGKKDAAAGRYTAGMGSGLVKEERAEFRAGYEAGWDHPDEPSTQNPRS